ncbi:hypothetical protein CP965_08745 [Halarcobacter mediterraneus]|uniref:Periplasmic protein n=1 Tax=Halarcobacter mediterraneus TaxID=2023153 RepID=A0A4Q1B222_9BACT|nr:hypothetical protein [Halarcobacter mediterraneus]RXK12656.1 hypothetical protein CP965_08745 [Halarcobacter mediterraneus]
MKKLLLIFICSIVLNANDLSERIINIIGNNKFIENKGLINYVFSKKNSFYDVNGRVQYIELLSKLQENGLLHLSFSKPQDINITFNINSDPIKSLKILADSLKSLGYYHYFTKKLLYTKEGYLQWIITLKTEAAIDPLMLSKEFEKYNCKLIDIKKEGLISWVYDIDTSFSTIYDAKEILVNEKIDLKKPLRPYVFKVSNANKILINSKYGNRWFPHIVFYDRHLKILDVVKKEQRHQKLEVEIPQYTKYIKVDDLFTLANIKRGLSVIIKEK